MMAVMKRAAGFAAVFLILIFMSGCSWFQAVESLFKPAEVEEKADDSKKSVADFYKALQQSIKDKPQVKKRTRPLTRYVDKVWLGGSSEDGHPEFFTQGQQNLPDTITHQQELVFMSAVDLDIKRVADRISEIIGIPVWVRSDNATAVKLVEKARLRYRGSLVGLLNVVAGSFDASWSYDEKSRSIIFTRIMTRVFDFHAPRDEALLPAAVLDSGGARAVAASAHNAWSAMKKTLISAMPQGSQISLSPDIGKITATTTPAAMTQVARLVHRRNLHFARQVHLNVQVLEIDVGEIKKSSNQEEISLSTLLGLIGLSVDAPGLNGDITKGGIATNEAYVSTHKLTSDEIVSTLRKIGKVSILTITNTRTRDGRATPIKSTSEQAYLSRAQTVSTGANVSSTDYKPATVMTGFSMNLRPRILPRARVQMDMSISLRVLNAIRNFGTDNNRIGLPEISTNSWTQEAIIPNGSTLLVSGFEHDRNKIAAAAAQADKADKNLGSRGMIIILVTPTIINRSYNAAG